MKVTTEITVYELDGKEVGVSDGEKLFITSHPFNKNMIILKFDHGELTVCGNDLRMAIQNAENHR